MIESITEKQIRFCRDFHLQLRGRFHQWKPYSDGWGILKNEVAQDHYFVVVRLYNKGSEKQFSKVHNFSEFCTQLNCRFLNMVACLILIVSNRTEVLNQLMVSTNPASILLDALKNITTVFFNIKMSRLFT